MSLIGLIFVGLIVVFLLILGSKVVPAVVEYIAIERAVQKIKNEASTVRDIQTAFERHRTIDDITSITAADLDITKEGDKIVISYAYAEEDPDPRQRVARHRLRRHHPGPAAGEGRSLTGRHRTQGDGTDGA